MRVYVQKREVPFNFIVDKSTSTSKYRKVSETLRVKRIVDLGFKDLNDQLFFKEKQRDMALKVCCNALPEYIML